MLPVRPGLVRPRQDDEFFGDVISGLLSSPKVIPSKWLWDERGTQIFEQLGDVQEHYLVRAERELLERHAAEVAEAIGPPAMLVELGESSTIRTRGKLEIRNGPLEYVPLELRESTSHAHPAMSRVATLPSDPEHHTVVLVGASLIGRLSPHEAISLLARAALLAGRGGSVLVAIDLKKPRRLIEEAYDDRRGIMASFNRNILVRINREIGATFDISRFRHLAPYDPIRGRVEMRLVSDVAQSILVGGYEISLTRGERIVTAHWYKYDLREFEQLARRAGLKPVHAWTDGQQRMSLHGLTVR
jgi:dimethylhistidine N-methyltransferase